MKSLLLAALLCLTAGIAVAGQQRAPVPPQTKCPVTGKVVDRSTFVDVDGFRIFTAGPAEADEVRRNPGKAFAALAKNREAAQQVIWVCPSMMQQVTPEFPYVQQAGKRIYYCCAPCQPRIKRDFKGAANTMKRLAEQGS